MLNSLDTLVTRNMFLFTTTGSFCQTFKSIFRARGLRPAFQAAVVRDSVQRTTQQPCSAAVASLRPPFGRSEVGKPKAGSELPLARCSDHLTFIQPDRCETKENRPHPIHSSGRQSAKSRSSRVSVTPRHQQHESAPVHSTTGRGNTRHAESSEARAYVSIGPTTVTVRTTTTTRPWSSRVMRVRTVALNHTGLDRATISPAERRIYPRLAGCEFET
jgi:hypothetical protein